MLKTKADILHAIQVRFNATLYATVVGEAYGLPSEGEGCVPVAWPYKVALGNPRADELASQMDEVSDYVRDLRAWSSDTGFEVLWSTRLAGGRQSIPTHVVVDSVDIAVRMLGTAARRQLALMRERVRRLCTTFSQVECGDAVAVLRATRKWADVDYQLLLDAAVWFATHDAKGLTPRQVPLAGFHAKWLNARGRRNLVARLAGLESLGLVEVPARVELAYLDPQYLVRGGRHYDLHVVGDVCGLPYEPHVVVIVENRDSFLYFPPIERGVCLFGAGDAGRAHIHQLPWIDRVPLLVYWGDMDADGLQILDGYRQSGLNVTSMLMDLESYRRYERFGTSQATGKQALETRANRHLEHLTADEQALYELLCSPTHAGHRRIEQERIPLVEALQALCNLVRLS